MDSYPKIQKISISFHIFIDYGFDFSEQQQQKNFCSVSNVEGKTNLKTLSLRNFVLPCQRGFFTLKKKKKSKKALLKLIM